MKAEKRLVTRIWHPEAVGDLFDLGHGVNAAVRVGQQPAYQLSGGEIIGLGSENFDYSGQALLTL